MASHKDSRLQYAEFLLGLPSFAAGQGWRCVRRLLAEQAKSAAAWDVTPRW